MGKRVKKREVMGIVAEWGDAAQWTWEIRNRMFNYVNWRIVYEVTPDAGSVMVAAAKSIDIAVAFTLGYVQASFDAPVPVVDPQDPGPTMFDNLAPSGN